MKRGHIPVMLEQTMQCWVNQGSKAVHFVDGTAGFGGHSEALLARVPNAKLLCIDRDPNTLMEAQERLQRFGSRVCFRQGSYQDLPSHLSQTGFCDQPDGILMDLGANSYQFDNPERGFSFKSDGPLDMRFDQSDTSLPTAAELVNQASEVQLTDIFTLYGEERYGKEAAKAIVRHRKRVGGLHTTRELRDCLESVLVQWKGRRKRSQIHSATLCFQALRIAVNRELDHVQKGLSVALESLAPSGRLAVIAFHSLEDKLVKQSFRKEHAAPEQRFKLVSRRALKPTEAECQSNPRARSARLRCIERVL